MQLMSMCNILATSSGSTFSFVAHLLNQVKNYRAIHSWIFHEDDIAEQYTTLLEKLRTLPADTVFYGAGNNMKTIIAYYNSVGKPFEYEIWDINAEKTKQLYGRKVSLPDFETKVEGNRNIVITIYDKAIAQELARKLRSLGWNVLNEDKDKVISVVSLMLLFAFETK
jgi:hypothetical protein